MATARAGASSRSRWTNFSDATTASVLRSESGDCRRDLFLFSLLKLSILEPGRARTAALERRSSRKKAAFGSELLFGRATPIGG